MTAPIALFVFDRPEHTRQVLESLRQNSLCRDSDLYVFSDGPKHTGQREAVDRVRSLVSSIEGFRSVSVFEQERNLGLAASITTGVTRLCEQFGRVIVLEDDLVVAPEFLDFMNRMLERFSGEERVMQISGYMYPGEFGTRWDTLFLPMISCWGWATWKRAWDCYDPGMRGYERLVEDPDLCARFNLDGAYDYLDMLEKQRAGEIDSWGIRWHLSVFLMSGLVLYPARSLVINDGIDGSGTHGRGTAGLQLARHDSTKEQGEYALPPRIEVSPGMVQKVRARLLATKPGLVTRLKRKIFG